MRLRHLGGAFLTVVCVATAVAPAVSNAATATRITINAQPNPIVAGDPVVIYGRLFGPTVANQVVTLYHRVAGQPRFTAVQTVNTDSTGRYEFTRLAGVVNTNRAWYVLSDGRRSRVVHERVAALVTFSGPAVGTPLLTGPAHRYTFTGTVSPAKAGARVLLQRQNAAVGGDDWGTIQTGGRVDATGHYTIVHVFSAPGDANLRVLVRADSKNIASPSSPVEYQIQQAQNPSLTIAGSPLPLVVGGVETITGTLQAGAGQQVSLYAATDNRRYQLAAVGTTVAGGSYTFTQTPLNSTFYYVKGAGQTSGRMFVAVRDALSPLVASATTLPAGATVTFSGSVFPNKTGHVVYLQRQNVAGDFHTIAVGTVGAGSTYSFAWRFFTPGAKVIRALVPGGPENAGAATAPITITVTAPPTLAALVPALG